MVSDYLTKYVLHPYDTLTFIHTKTLTNCMEQWTGMCGVDERQEGGWGGGRMGCRF